MNDLDLLDAYARERSEDAFRELVSRHLNLIYSSAMRQLGNAQLAQEATQTAFIALARKAGNLPGKTVVAGWLYRAAHFAALNLQRDESRRKQREEEAALMEFADTPDARFDEAALPQVDRALAELGDVDRAAVVLRFLNQKSFRDVADALGLSEDAAKKRVTRALEKLRRVLSRRGVAVPAAGLAAALSQLPTAAAPASLNATVGTMAINAAASGTAAGMTLQSFLASAKLKLAIACIVAAGGLTALLWDRPPQNAFAAAATTAQPSGSMRINIASILVEDQEKALQFYTEVLGFVKKMDVPTGAARWLTVVSPDEPDGPQLLLEPMGFAPAKVFQKALYSAGIPLTALMARDLQNEYERMNSKGVKFSTPPTKMGDVTFAVFDDTCGNRIQLFQPEDVAPAGNVSGIAIRLNSVMTGNQEKALQFYTEVLGFKKKTDIPAGGGRWITVVSPEGPAEMELALEPIGFAAAQTYQKALFEAGIPLTSFAVRDVNAEYERLTKQGVGFKSKPVKMGPVTMAIFDDTCGNLIQIVQNQ